MYLVCMFPDYPYSLKCTMHALLTTPYDADFAIAMRPTMTACGDNLPRLTFLGGCVGARVGLDGIPRDWIEKTDKGEEIVGLAKQLAQLRKDLP